MQVTPTQGACGAIISGLDLSTEQGPDTIAALRTEFLKHHVLVFPEQELGIEDLERFTQYFGPFGHDPFFSPIDQSEHICAIERRADETASIFAENWHSDWSFQKVPPAATLLYGITIPPKGGNTDFADQHKALAAMPAELREKLEGKIGIHTAKVAYSPEGMYGDADKDANRAMRIVISEEANESEPHPIIRKHPESGEEGLFSTLGYILGIEGMADEEAIGLLMELQSWQSREEFVYHHEWQPNMLVMWDNRSVLHKANGGYEGYDRLLHRTTVADDPTYY